MILFKAQRYEKNLINQLFVFLSVEIKQKKFCGRKIDFSRVEASPFWMEVLHLLGEVAKKRQC